MTHSRDHEPAHRAETSTSSLPTAATSSLPTAAPVPPEPLTPSAVSSQPTTSEFIAAAATPEYARLRRTFRSFAFPMTIAGLASYFVYVVLSIYAPKAMGTMLFGSFTVGMVLGLFQFVVTYAWTAIYVRFANRRLDPISSDLKARLVGEEPA